MPRMQGNSVNIGGNGGNYFYIDWQLASQSIANNTSRINWQAKFHYNMADAQLDNGNASLSGGRWSNGGRVRNFGADFRTRSVTLASGSFTIGHNSNGTRSLSVSGGIDVYQSGRSSGAQSFSLPTIPRNSQVTSPSSATLGDPIRINTNRKSSSFSHTLTLRLNNSSGTVLQTINSVGASYTWTPSASQITLMQNAIPNSNSLTLHITQRNNQVGENSTTTTRLNLTNANPEFDNFTYRDSSSVASITGNDQVLVKGKSTLTVTIPSADRMVAIKGSNPRNYAIAYEGLTNQRDYSTSNIASVFDNINTTGSRSILTTAYDSRGNSTTVAKNVQVYDYTPPNIEFEVSRENNFGSDVTIETGGTFDLLPINGSNRNAITASSLKYRYRTKGTTTWGTWTNIPFTVTGGEFSGTNQFISLDNTKAFEFEFQVADKFGTHTQATELGAGTPIMFTGRYSDGSTAVGINKVPEQGVLDVDGDIYSNGKKVATTILTDTVVPTSNFGVADNTNWQNTGMKITLPSPGTYIVESSVRVQHNAGSARSYSIGRLYNETESSVLTDSVTLLAYFVTGNSQATTVLKSVVTTTSEDTVIRLEVQMGETGYSNRTIYGGNANGTTRLSYIKVA